jgi:hypothetical protein
MIDLLITYHDVFVALHTISFAIGLGAATVHDVAFSYYLGEFDKERWNSLAYKICFQLIRSSLFWTVLSGLALYLPNAASLNASALFQFKTLLVCLIMLNSYYFHHRLVPKLANSFCFDSSQTSFEKSQLRSLHRLSFALGAISLSSWYSVASLGGLRNLDLGFPILLAVYLAIIVLSVGSSFMAEAKFAKKLELSSQVILKTVANELLSDGPEAKVKASSVFWEAYRLRSQGASELASEPLRERPPVN